MPDQIIPFLTHQDPKVRDLALRYLSEAHDPSPATAEDIWKSVDSFGGGRYNVAYAALSKLPQTDASLRRTLEAIKREPDKDVRSHLERVIRGLKSGLLMRYSDLIEQAPRLSQELRDYLKQRIDLAALPPAELWERLMALGQQFGEEESSRDYHEVQCLVDALSHSPEAAGWAISTLNDESIDDWRRVFAVQVLGILRFRPAAELVLQKLHSDEESDALTEECVDTLARIGSPQVIEAVQKQFAGWSWGFRISATGLFRKVKLPQSEMAAFALLQNESDIEVRTFLAGGLCELITTHPPAIDLLVQMVGSDDFDSSLVELDQDVSTLCTMLGRPKPQITKSAKQPSRPFLDAPGETYAFARESDESDGPVEVPKLPVSFETPTPTPPPQPVRRQGPKIGRNDPCPCGSGKKYKKCCGK